MKNLLVFITICIIPISQYAYTPEHTPLANMLRFMDFAKVTTVVMEHQATTEELYSDAVCDYELSQWADARIKFNKYLDVNGISQSDYLCASIMLIKSKLNGSDYISAIRSVDYLIHCVEMNEKTKQDLEWDKAICYLAVNKDKAKKLFSDIKSDDGSPMQKEACAMVDLLR